MKYLFQKTKRSSAVRAPLPPGPSPMWPILGCVPHMLRNRPAYRWIHRLMKELNTDIACFRLVGNSHVIGVTSPEIAREFLKKHDAVFALRPDTMATCIVSKGYLTTALCPGGEQWKKMRRILASQVLSLSTMRWLLDMRNQESDNLVRYLYNQCSKNLKGDVVNVRTAAQHYPANAMRRMMFGRRYFGKGREDGGPGFEEEEHVSSFFTMLLHIYAFSVSDYFPWLQSLDLDGHRKKVCDAVKVVDKYHDPIITDRIQEWREGKKTQPEDLLDVLISLKDSNGNPLLSKDEIRAKIT
ncbi:isoleucine N-monooxygenase 2, partial [Morus notabilis]